MATKGFVDYNAKRHVQYFSSGTFEKGSMLVAVTVGYSGIALESATRIAYVAANGSGLKPVGFSEAKVVNIDLTRQKLNPFDPLEVQTGYKIPIIFDGWMDTNQISGTPTAMADAYLAPNGQVSATQLAGYPLVGKFLTAKDSAGYAQVLVRL